jgi:tRNA(fMet)-specific endonuclease VapC
MDATLLDTDILSEVFKQRDLAVKRRAATYLGAHGQFAFSALSRFEIERGYKEKIATRQLLLFAEFCRHSLVLAISDAVLNRAADLWAFARLHGHPHGDADLIIAATAVETGRVLITGNTAHFTWVPSLIVDDWRMPQE